MTASREAIREMVAHRLLRVESYDWNWKDAAPLDRERLMNHAEGILVALEFEGIVSRRRPAHE